MALEAISLDAPQRPAMAAQEGQISVRKDRPGRLTTLGPAVPAGAGYWFARLRRTVGRAGLLQLDLVTRRGS